MPYNDTSSPTPNVKTPDDLSVPDNPKAETGVRCSALVRFLNHKLINFIASCLSPFVSHGLSVQKGYMIGKQLQKMRLHKEVLDARKQARILWEEEQAMELQESNKAILTNNKVAQTF
jgi:hypothetical protein